MVSEKTRDVAAGAAARAWRALAALLISAALCAVDFGDDAGAADGGSSCKAPAWTKTIAVRKEGDEMFAVGSDAQPGSARLAARLALGRQLAAEKGLNVLAMPQVAPKVNRTVYTDVELAKAVAQAAAFNLTDMRRLKEERVCNTWYVALATSQRGWLDSLAKNSELGDHVQLALSNRLAAKEQERLRDADAAVRRDAQKALNGPLASMSRLRSALAALPATGLVGELLHADLAKRVAEVERLIEPTKTMSTAAEIDAAAAAAEPKIQSTEKFAVGASDYAKGDFAGAYGPLVTFGDAGDPDAQFAVGVMHAYAQGIKRDDEEAMRWLKRAAANRHGPAKVMIGAFELAGRSSPPSATKAGKWFQGALNEGWSCEMQVVSCRQKPR